MDPRSFGLLVLDSYVDANRYPLHPNQTFPDELVKGMRRGYRAAVSYMDWMTGNVLLALNTSSAADDTVVVVRSHVNGPDLHASQLLLMLMR